MFMRYKGVNIIYREFNFLDETKIIIKGRTMIVYCKIGKKNLHKAIKFYKENSK